MDEHTAGLLFSHAIRSRLFAGIEVLVPRPAHLAAMKIQAMKDDPSRTLRELEDIRLLMKLPGTKEDLEAIRASARDASTIKTEDYLRFFAQFTAGRQSARHFGAEPCRLVYAFCTTSPGVLIHLGENTISHALWGSFGLHLGSVRGSLVQQRKTIATRAVAE